MRVIRPSLCLSPIPLGVEGPRLPSRLLPGHPIPWAPGTGSHWNLQPGTPLPSPGALLVWQEPQSRGPSHSSRDRCGEQRATPQGILMPALRNELLCQHDRPPRPVGAAVGRGCGPPAPSTRQRGAQLSDLSSSVTKQRCHHLIH